MRRALLALVVLGALSGPAGAQTLGCQTGFPPPLVGKAFEQLTVSTTAVGLTASNLGGALCAVVVVETNPIRYRDDGTAPTATVGTFVPAVQATAGAPGAFSIIGQRNLSAVRFIRDTGAAGDAKLDVHYYGRQ